MFGGIVGATRRIEARGPLPPGRSSAVVSRARAAHARALARARRLPRVDPPPRGREAVPLLRGPADRQRPPGLAPRPGARLQGRVPALPDDARPLRPAQGGLGLPRPARRARGREGARLPQQARHRALRGRRVQRQVPRVGAPLHRRVERSSPSGSASGSTPTTPTTRSPTTTSSRSGGRSSRSGRRASSPRATGSCPYCTALRHGALLARAGAGLQDVVDPSVYGSSRCWTSPDVSLLAWTTMPWTLVPHAAIAVDPEVTYARARHGDDALILAEPLVERVLGEGAEVVERMKGSELLGLRYEPPFPYICGLRRARPHGPGRRLRLDRGRHGRGAHRRGVRRGRLPARPPRTG